MHVNQKPQAKGDAVIMHQISGILVSLYLHSIGIGFVSKAVITKAMQQLFTAMGFQSLYIYIA